MHREFIIYQALMLGSAVVCQIPSPVTDDDRYSISTEELESRARNREKLQQYLEKHPLSILERLRYKDTHSLVRGDNDSTEQLVFSHSAKVSPSTSLATVSAIVGLMVGSYVSIKLL